MRGVAACFVVAWHGEAFSGFKPGSGYLAVAFFFCLSGFVLAHAYSTKLLLNQLSFKKFVIIRLIRFYPLYFVSIALSCIFITAAMIVGIKTNWNMKELLGSFTLSLFFLPTPPIHTDSVFPLNNPAWSLFFEMVINALWALALTLGISRLTSIGIYVVSTILFIACVYSYGSSNFGGHWITFWYVIPWVIISFMSGLYIYNLREKVTLLFSPYSVIIVLCVFLLIDPGQWRVYYDILFVILVAPLLVIFGSKQEVYGFDRRIFAYIGDASYAIYAIHIPLLSVFEVALFKILKINGSIILEGFIILFVVVVGHALNLYLDIPLRKRLLGVLSEKKTSSRVLERL